MSSQVIHVKDMPRFPNAIYIGRTVPRRGLKASPFANPFKIGEHGNRSDVIATYASWLLGQPHLLALLPELRGKPLACWCRHDSDAGPLCHADVILEMLACYTDIELREANRAQQLSWHREGTGKAVRWVPDGDGE